MKNQYVYLIYEGHIHFAKDLIAVCKTRLGAISHAKEFAIRNKYIRKSVHCWSTRDRSMKIVKVKLDE